MVMLFADPISTPILFMFTYFLFGLPTIGISAFVSLVLYSTVLAYPFAFLGNRVYRMLEKRIERALIRLYITSVICTLAFWILFQIWTLVLSGKPAFIVGDIAVFALSVLFLSLIVSLFAFIGMRLRSFMSEYYKMPLPLQLFLVSLAAVSLFWLVCLALYILIGESTSVTI